MLKSSLNFQKFINFTGRILRIKNAKFSGYRYYMNTNIHGDFQISVSVTLTPNIWKIVSERKSHFAHSAWARIIFPFLYSFSNLYNIANVLNLSRIRFNIWGPLQEIVSVQNLAVRLCEDSNAWKFLRLYLLSLVTNWSIMIGGVKAT